MESILTSKFTFVTIGSVLINSALTASTFYFWLVTCSILGSVGGAIQGFLFSSSMFKPPKRSKGFISELCGIFCTLVFLPFIALFATFCGASGAGILTYIGLKVMHFVYCFNVKYLLITTFLASVIRLPKICHSFKSEAKLFITILTLIGLKCLICNLPIWCGSIFLSLIMSPLIRIEGKNKVAS